MNSDTAQQFDTAGAAHSGRGFAFALGGASLVMLFAAGGLLWWRHGDAVFTEIALAGLAWCF
ncbi:MAG TPA: hypothetical protein VLQ65_16910 [Saliniramus sp.]|nr:hypothetical protein [Saliniramus sp.]